MIFVAKNEYEKRILDEGTSGGSSFYLTNIQWAVHKKRAPYEATGLCRPDLPLGLIVDLDVKVTPESAEREFAITRQKLQNQFGATLLYCRVEVLP